LYGFEDLHIVTSFTLTSTSSKYGIGVVDQAIALFKNEIALKNCYSDLSLASSFLSVAPYQYNWDFWES
jgi:hypothetical protein